MGRKNWGPHTPQLLHAEARRLSHDCPLMTLAVVTACCRGDATKRSDGGSGLPEEPPCCVPERADAPGDSGPGPPALG